MRLLCNVFPLHYLIFTTTFVFLLVSTSALAGDEATIRVQLGSTLHSALIVLAKEHIDDTHLSVRVNGEEVGFVPVKEGVADLKFIPLEGKNRIRFLLLRGAKKARIYPKYHINPLVNLFNLKSIHGHGKLFLLLTMIQNAILEFDATPGSLVDSILDITADRNEFQFAIREPEADNKPENSSSLELLGILLHPVLEERELASEVIETPAGVEQEYEISRTLERSVNFSEAMSLEIAGKVDLKVVGGEIRAKLERDQGQVFRQSETIRRNLKIDGTKTAKLQVIWVGVFQKGSASIYFNGEKKTLPFTIQTGLKPKLQIISD